MFTKTISLLCLLLLPLISVKAAIKLPAVFSDHMVLQQNTNVKFWGWADPNEEVIISPSWTTKSYTTTGNNLAEWNTEIATPKAGGPYSITFKGYNYIEIKDVYIGEVWFCSGQSNMEMSASWGIENGEEEIQKSQYPEIRFFKVPKLSADSPQNNLPANWDVCTPESMKYNSALSYYFARKLQDSLNVPIGLMVSAWGGTPAEIWIPSKVIQEDALLTSEANRLQPNEWGPIQPGKAFNAMVAPLTQYHIAGFLWYQGESNVGSTNYDLILTALINSWRELWKSENLPFYFVQIAPYNYEGSTDAGAKIRDAQRKVAHDVANTAMVVTSDISTTDDIHPKNKKSVGERLANIALKNTYKTYDGVIAGPTFKKIEVEKNKIIVHFTNNEGLYFSNKDNQFEIAGEDGVFHTAKATIKNNTIYLKSKQVKNPVNVRFAWGNTIQSNLFNNAKLPASSFIAH
ncbi:sialate O-acetylesterase [Pustulibacterium marinum]|uniref:Sialate O-acetylesterase n=1 Tax=Pustulibacterium marinum TaxID=1224947 RepID=A0A1I7GG78_9FLAO|nr:sialate O-acetylesterase [Pustulibacterium marinum]SFU47438.1 sialate O-acetylesterase [Pustulibacterium marinum]